MSSSPAPQWVPDSERPFCRGCQVQFSWLVRRHHCRICGEVYCDPCTRRRVYVGAENLARVCDSCQSLFRKGNSPKAVFAPRVTPNRQTLDDKSPAKSPFNMGSVVLLMCAVVCAVMDWSFAPQEEDSLKWWRGALIVTSLSVCGYHAVKQARKFLHANKVSSTVSVSFSSTPVSKSAVASTSAAVIAPITPPTVPVSVAAKLTMQKALASALPFALEGWDPPQSVHGALLSRKKVAGAPLDPIQMEGLVHGVSPQVLCQLFHMFEFKKVKQAELKYSECLEKLEGGLQVLIEETNLPWPVANRDMVFVTCAQPYKDGMMIVGADFEHPLRPPAASSPVRARVSSVHLMTPEPGMENVVRLRLTSMFDPRGNIPISLINALIAENCKVFAKIDAFLASPQGKLLIEKATALIL